MAASSWSLNKWVGACLYVFGLARRVSTFGFQYLRELVFVLIFCYDASTELVSIMRTDLLCISVLSAALGPQSRL